MQGYSELYGGEGARSRKGRLAAEFKEQFGEAPAYFFSSPGRAEIVGNHTDHNGGKVLVSAISCDVMAAVSPRSDGNVVIASGAYYPIRFSVHDLSVRERERGRSISLVRGILRYLSGRSYSFGGFSCVTHSNIFRGAGVSSSAAFEVLIAEIVNELYLGGRLPAMDKARAGMYAENDYFGKPCGLLDQAGIALGGLNEIDFSSREPLVTPVPAPEGYRLVLTNTGGSHAKLTNHYADIRREMGEVAAFFHKKYLFELSERDLLEALPELRQKVSDRAVLRAFHFFEENKRVELAARALQEGDTALFFEQVLSSGESSLKYLQNCYIPGDTFEPVVIALKLSEKVLRGGAYRMMGGGFTGTVLAFCPAGGEERYSREMARVFGKENVFVTDLRAEGACALSVSNENH